jgi:small subunit ribosomal protein S17
MKKILIGTVASASQAKTLRVEIDRRMKHPKYGKIIRGRTICHVHDEQCVAKQGDMVEITEAPPRSASKRWDLVRVISSKAVVEAPDAAT